jgi:NADH-quinone oxidoreductase subunit L
VVTAPLILLAIPSVVIGFLTIGPMLFGDFFKDAIFINLEKHPGMEELAKEFHGAVQMAAHSVFTAPLWLALSGVALAYYLYMVNTALPARIQSWVQPVYRLLDNKYYMDWFNENVLAAGARLLGRGLWKGGDQGFIDGLLVNGSWRIVSRISAWVRGAQTGYIYHYALVMIFGVLVLMTYFVWLSR